MMLTGVHIVDGKVIRWRVENVSAGASHYLGRHRY